MALCYIIMIFHNTAKQAHSTQMTSHKPQQSCYWLLCRTQNTGSLTISSKKPARIYSTHLLTVWDWTGDMQKVSLQCLSYIDMRKVHHVTSWRILAETAVAFIIGAPVKWVRRGRFPSKTRDLFNLRVYALFNRHRQRPITCHHRGRITKRWRKY